MSNKPKAKTKRLSTPKGRISYPCLETARAPEGGGKAKFSVTIIFDKSAQQSEPFKALVADVDRVIREAFGADEANRLRALQAKQPQRKIWSEAFRDGNQKLDKDGNIEPVYKDCVYLVASTEFDDFKREGLYDATGAKIEPKQLYAGCYARLRVTAHDWTHPTGGAGVSFWFNGAQFLAHGERLGGGGMSASEFDAIEGAQPLAAEFAEQGVAPIDDENLPF